MDNEKDFDDEYPAMPEHMLKWQREQQQAAQFFVSYTEEKNKQEREREEKARIEAAKRHKDHDFAIFCIVMFCAFCAHFAVRYVLQLRGTIVLATMKDSDKSYLYLSIFAAALAVLYKLCRPGIIRTFLGLVKGLFPSCSQIILVGVIFPTAVLYLVKLFLDMLFDMGLHALICESEKSPGYLTLGLPVVVILGGLVLYYIREPCSRLSTFKNNSWFVIALWAFVFVLPVLVHVWNPPVTTVHYCTENVVDKVVKQMEEDPTLKECPEAVTTEEENPKSNVTWDNFVPAPPRPLNCIPVKQYKIVTDATFNEFVVCNSVLLVDLASSRIWPSRGTGWAAYDYITLAGYVPYCVVQNIRYFTGDIVFMRSWFSDKMGIWLAAARGVSIASRVRNPRRSWDQIYSEDGMWVQEQTRAVGNIISRVVQPLKQFFSPVFVSRARFWDSFWFLVFAC